MMGLGFRVEVWDCNIGARLMMMMMMMMIYIYIYIFILCIIHNKEYTIIPVV